MTLSKSAFPTLVVLVCAIILYSIFINQEKETQRINKENYALWRTCITLSDYSDISCEECDEVHNPNNLDFDMDSTKVTFTKRNTISK